ncbi:MAG: transporter substrate-binding domain-containing protein [Pseudomonadota bacterium]
MRAAALASRQVSWLGRVLLLACVALQAGAAWAQSARRVALVIGNDRYQHIEPLKNAKNDARLFSQLLREAGFEVIAQEDAGREQFWAAVDRAKNRVNKGDELVFFYAGHGVQVGASQFLLPVDIRPPENDRQVERNAIPLVEVLDAFTEARVSVFVIDACRDNPFPRTGTRSIGGTRGLARPEPTTGQIVILSAGRDQKAMDEVPGQGARNGLFTHELVDVIRRGNPEVREAFETVKERVDDKARRANHLQRPSVSHDLRGQFRFFPASVTAMPAAPVAPATVVAALPPRPVEPVPALPPVQPAPAPAAPIERIAANPATSATMQKVAASGRITMGVREASSVLSYTTGDGQYAGFHVELCRRIVDALGRSLGRAVKVDYQPVTSQNRIPLVQNGTVDIECGSTTNNTARQQDVAFLNTMFVEETRIAVRANSGIGSVAQLAGRNVATTTGTTSVQLLRRHRGAAGLAFNEVYGRDHADSFVLLESGRADAFVMDSLILGSTIAQARNPGEWRICCEALSQEPVAIMVRKDDGFRKFGNDVLAELVRSGEMQRIYNRWFTQPVPGRRFQLAVPASAATLNAWADQNDRPWESYAGR